VLVAQNDSAGGGLAPGLSVSGANGAFTP